MPLLKSSGSPNASTFEPPVGPLGGSPLPLPLPVPLLDVPRYRCWSTMNGAVARPAIVRATGVSVLLIRPSLFASYAAPPAYVSAYSLALKSAHGVVADSVVVV